MQNAAIMTIGLLQTTYIGSDFSRDFAILSCSAHRFCNCLLYFDVSKELISFYLLYCLFSGVEIFCEKLADIYRKNISMASQNGCDFGRS